MGVASDKVFHIVVVPSFQESCSRSTRTPLQRSRLTSKLGKGPRSDPIADQDPKANQCTTTSKSTGSRCTQPAIPGGNVCRYHGGAAPQAKKAAAHLAIERLRALLRLSESRPGANQSFDSQASRLRAGSGGMLGQKVIPNKNSAWFWLLEKPPLGSRKCCAPHRV